MRFKAFVGRMKDSKSWLMGRIESSGGKVRVRTGVEKVSVCSCYGVLCLPHPR